MLLISSSLLVGSFGRFPPPFSPFMCMICQMPASKISVSLLQDLGPFFFFRTAGRRALPPPLFPFSVFCLVEREVVEVGFLPPRGSLFFFPFTRLVRSSLNRMGVFLEGEAAAGFFFFPADPDYNPPPFPFARLRDRSAGSKKERTFVSLGAAEALSGSRALSFLAVNPRDLSPSPL